MFIGLFTHLLVRYFKIEKFKVAKHYYLFKQLRKNYINLNIALSRG